LARKDVKAVFAGLRPLVKIPGKTKTALMPRDHTIIISASGMISITGGKWTTYRKMAKDVVDRAISIGQLPARQCITETHAIHGHLSNPDKSNPLHYYGTDLALIKDLEDSNAMLKEKIHPSYPYTKALVMWAVQQEMAMTLEDVLSRRIRLLLLDAQAAVDAAPSVARLMAKTLNQNEDWVLQQISEFKSIAKNYIL
jgi:glycerol-3-phosphate dehydrogenase